MNTQTGDAKASRNSTVKQRKRTREERRRIVEEILVPGTSVAVVARAHGVNPNQVYHWRKLYERGLLKGEVNMAELVPVKIAGAGQPWAAVSRPEAGQQTEPSCSHAGLGTIHLVTKEMELRVEGRADAGSLRVILERLLR